MEDKYEKNTDSTATTNVDPTSTSKLIKSTPYQSNRKALPFDENVYSISTRMDCSRTLVRNAIRSLDKKRNDSLYMQICDPEYKRKTKSKARIKAQKSGKKDPECPVDTRPSEIFWESSDLICALIQAKQANRKKSGDDLAKEAFRQLANNLAESNLENAEKSFVKTQMLCSPSVRAELISRFYSEIDLRIKALEYFTKTIPAYLSVPNIYEACQTMDSMLLNMIQRFSLNYYPFQGPPKPYTREFLDLYILLTKHRKSLTDYQYETAEKANTFSTEFALPDTEQGRRIINELSNPSITSNPDKFLTAYQEYLLTNIPKETQGWTQEFSQWFKNINEYIARKKDFDKTSENLEQALHEIISAIFSDLEQNNIICYPFARFESASLGDAYISKRLEYVHQQIMATIHTSLIRMIHARTLIYYKAKAFSVYFCSDDEARLVLEQFNIVMDARNKLAAQYPNLPLGATIADISPEEFATCYKKTVFIAPSSDQPLDPIIQDILSSLPVDNLPPPQVYWALDALCQLLLYSCHIVACYEATISIENLRQEYFQLQNFYQEL